MNKCHRATVSGRLAVAALAMVMTLSGCASLGAARRTSKVMDDPTRTLVVGSTTQDQVRSALGKADEVQSDEDQCAIWIYHDVVDIPMAISFIPIIGDITDVVEMTHKNRELILQFDPQGVVKKVKVRSLD